MQSKFITILLFGIIFTSQIFCDEEDLGPEERKFHKKKKKPQLQSPCHRSNDPEGRFFDNSYQVNYYGNPYPCVGPSLGNHKPHKPHKPFGGHGHGGHGHGGHHGGHFGGHGGGGGGGLFGGQGGGGGGLFGGYGGGFGGHKPGGGYFDALGGNFKPNKIIKDVNKLIFRPLYHLL